VKKLFNFVQSHLSILDLNSCAIRVIFIKILCMPTWFSVFPTFSGLISPFQVLHSDF
jgi:hypothetical protein